MCKHKKSKESSVEKSNSTTRLKKCGGVFFGLLSVAMITFMFAVYFTGVDSYRNLCVIGIGGIVVSVATICFTVMIVKSDARNNGPKDTGMNNRCSLFCDYCTIFGKNKICPCTNAKNVDAPAATESDTQSDGNQ